MANVYHPENFSEFSDLLTTNKHVLVDVFATWCGPCKMVKPTLTALAESYPDIAFVFVDIEKVDEMKDIYNIRSVPTVFTVKSNELYEMTTGFGSAGKYQLMIDNLVN